MSGLRKYLAASKGKGRGSGGIGDLKSRQIEDGRYEGLPRQTATHHAEPRPTQDC